MKKIISVLLCLIMILSLFACKDTENENNTETTPKTETDASKESDDSENDSKTEWVISPEEALEIASDYWNVEDGFVDYGAGSMWICRIIMFASPDHTLAAKGYYHIGLQIDHYGRDKYDLRVLIESRLKRLFVDATTGECREDVPFPSDYE